MKKWQTVKVAPMQCPHCDFYFSEAGMTSPNAPIGARPARGQCVICNQCGEISIIGEDGKTLRKLTLEEDAALPLRPYFAEMMADSLYIKAKRGTSN